MTQPINLFLTTPQFFALGSQIEGARSKLSPLSITGAQQAARERVLNPELVTEDGRLRPELASAFRVLAAAQSFCVVGYAGRSASYEIAGYYPGNTISPEGVSLVYRGEGMQLQSPPVMDDAFELIRQYTGNTLLKRVEIEADLPILDAWLLFGVMDVCRRKSLGHILDHDESASDGLTIEEIRAALESKKPGLQWLAPYFDECLLLATPTPTEVSAGLKRLVSQGLLTLSGTDYLPGELARQMIAEFLLVDAHLRIRAAALDRSGAVVSTDARAIQGRSGSILLWSHDISSVSLWGASPAQLLALIDSLIKNPSQSIQPTDKNSFDTMPQIRSRVPPPPEKL